MRVSIVSDLDTAMPTPLEQRRTFIKSAFLDTGGSVDSACLTMFRTDVPARIIYVTGAMYWKLDERQKILFATIRNDIAKLHLINKFDMMGCETNNYGRNEMESLRLEYGIAMHGITTSGKITNEKVIKRGIMMDKHAIIQFANQWRTNVLADPDNEHPLGQIKFPKKKTDDLKQLIFELDSFIRKEPQGIGTGQPKYGAAGSGHDDGPLSMLGHLFMLKTKVFRIFTGRGAVASARHDGTHREETQPVGRAVGQIPRNDNII